jgi:uncharacterized phiE125 gp8 family phage protein
MQITKLTNPTTLPISLDDVKDHLRIERDEIDYNDDLTELIYTARDYIQSETHLTLITTQYRCVWDCWPAEVVKLPAWPIQSVDAVKYKDTDGAEQTLSSALYRTKLIEDPGTIQPAISTDWPSLQSDAVEAVTVDLTAGYGDAADDIPHMVRHLLKLTIAHWFRHREAIGLSTSNSPMKLAFESLRDEVRVNEWQEFIIQSASETERTAGRRYWNDWEQGW